MPRVAKYEENDEPIAGYRLVSFLGQGQFGEVWKAIESTTGKFVAIKIIDLSHSNSALKELKALNLVKNLNHPHLIPIFTARLKDKNGREIPLHRTEELKGKGVLRELIIAMGLGDKSLSARLKEFNPDGTDPADFKGIPVEELLGYMQGAAKGIDFLNKADHGLGIADGPIVHCDIKPDNMMIVAGEVQIVDCGVAVIITPDVRQTKAAGSPAYSAPELTGNKPVPGTDQYALAISYYELRCGRLPFDEQMGQLSIMLAHAEGRLDFGSPILTEEEVRVLRWATSVRPKERYATCFDMVKQLERAIEGLPPIEPSRIGVKSGVVPSPKSRLSSPPLDPSMLRSTPNLPLPAFQPPIEKKPDADVSFELPDDRGELRGTVIPNTERYLPPTAPGPTLPAPDLTSTNAEFSIPIERGEPFPDEETGPPVSPATPTVSAQGPTTGTDRTGPARSTDYTRPQIAIDGDDPLGARAGTIELDPEIARIIKAGPVATRTAVQYPAAPPVQAVQTQVAPAKVESTPIPEIGKRSTEYPRETPAEEEAKSLPPWMKEAKAAELERNRSSSHSVISGTNWKAPEAKAGGGLAVKVLIGGVLVAGIAAGGAYFSGLIGGKGSSQASGALPKDPKEKDPIVDPGKGSPKVDPAKIKEIDDLIAKKTIAALDAAQAEVDKHLTDSADEPQRNRLNDAIAQARKDLAKPAPTDTLKASIEEIDGLIRAADPTVDAAAAKRKIDDAQKRIDSLLPVDLPEPYKSKREAWKTQIASKRTAIATATTNREFQMVLDGLDKESEADIKAAAKVAIERYLNSPVERKLLGRRLVAIGEGKKTHRDAIVPILLEGDRFTLLLDDKDRETVVGWRTEKLRAAADALRDSLNALAKGTHAKDSPAVQAAAKALENLKVRKKAVADEFGTHWDDKYVAADLTKFIALATVWSDARKGTADGIKSLRGLAQATAPPDLALPLSLEYFRIGVESAETVANLRLARDSSKNWKALTVDDRKRIDDLFQAALAIRVRTELSVTTGKPKWSEILKTCDTDSALGWKAAVEAEQRLEAGTALGSITSDETADETRADRAAFLAYLAAAAKGDADAAATLANLHKAPPPILNATFRRKRAAGVLAANAIVVSPVVQKPEAILDGTWKPYAANPKSLAWLKKADELDGGDRKDWALHLYLLAEASNDRDTARIAARKVAMNDAKLPVAELSLAMTYFRSRAAEADADQATRVGAHAAMARIAYRLLDATVDPKEDQRTREKSFLPKIETLAKAGLSIAGGREEDQLSLRFSALRPDFLLYDPVRDKDQWFAKVRPEIEKVVRGLPIEHPDLAEARACRAFVTLMRFSVRGDLNEKKSSDEDERLREWKAMIADAEAAVKLDPESHFGHHVLGLATFTSFKLFNYVYSPPRAVRLTTGYYENRTAVLDAANHLEKATTSRPNAILWIGRSNLMFLAASDFAKAGESTETVKKLLLGARVSAQKADDQRSKKRIDELRLLGCVQEDLAWLGQDDPVRNYSEAIRSLTAAIERPVEDQTDRVQFFIGIGDRARATVRAVQYGYFPKTRLADADTVLDKLVDEAGKLADDQRTDAIKSELAKGLYWRAVRHLVAEDYGEAAAAFDRAAAALRPYIADQHAFCFAHSAEAALADRRKAKDDTLKAVDDAIEKLAAVADSEGAKASMGFVPDYLKARRALLAGETRTATTAFATAHRAIAEAWRRRTLRVEDAFALRCLAHEILNVDLGGSLQSRQDLLREFEKAFPWSMTPADKKLVADALKK